MAAESRGWATAPGFILSMISHADIDSYSLGEKFFFDERIDLVEISARLRGHGATACAPRAALARQVAPRPAPPGHAGSRPGSHPRAQAGEYTDPLAPLLPYSPSLRSKSAKNRRERETAPDDRASNTRPWVSDPSGRKAGGLGSMSFYPAADAGTLTSW